MDQADLIKRLRLAFAEEAAERLVSLRNSLVELEKAKSPEDEEALVEIAFREAHSLKGASRAVNMCNVETLCQHLESVFSLIKRSEVFLRAELFDIFHNSVKLIDDIIQNGGDDASYKAEEVEFAVARLDDIDAGNVASIRPGVSPDLSSPAVSEGDGAPSELIGEDDLLNDLNGLADSADDEAGEVIAGEPLSESCSKVSLRSGDAEETTANTAASGSESSKPAMRAGVRISTDKLDNLLLKTEELLSLKLISKEQLSKIKAVSANCQSRGDWYHEIDSDLRCLKKMVRKEAGNAKKDSNTQRISRLLSLVDSMMEDHKSFSRELFELVKIERTNSHVLERMIDDFSDDVKSTAMLPLHSLFQVYPGMVRDIARSQGKEIDLQITGAELEIDKRILEELQDPLTHIIRNSADHGIEEGGTRRDNGKCERGVIELSVRQIDGNALEISIADDGGGINFARVKEKALEDGLLSDSDAATENQLTSLIFQSGLSTSPIITELSGRGLGLAIVKEKIESLGGKLSVKTEHGRGTTFTMRIPTTLTTLRGILLKVGGEMFAIPNLYVEHAMKIDASAINRVKGRATISIDKEVLLLARLADILGITLPWDSGVAEYNIVVLRCGNARSAIIVDEIYEEQEILIKKMGSQLRRVENIAGATILGSGKIVPVLNVNDLFISIGRASGALRQIEEKKAEKPKILLVEDSITSRMLVKNILEAAGYDVSVAIDGMAGLEFLRGESVDLVVSDVEMPRMGGFELTKAIREDEKLADLPVILVTSLATQEDQQKGVDVGANAYIIKGDFDQVNFLESIKRLT